MRPKRVAHLARVFGGDASYESTHRVAAAAAAAEAVGHGAWLGCLVEKHHLKRLGTCLRSQTKKVSAGLDA